MSTISIRLRHSNGKDGKDSTIYVTYTHKGRKFPESIGKVNPLYWNNDMKKVSPEHIMADNLNEKIKQQILKFEIHEKHLRQQNVDPTVVNMRDSMKKGIQGNALVLNTYKEYIQFLQKIGKDFATHKNVMKGLKKFEQINRLKLHFNDFDKNFVLKLVYGWTDGTYSTKKGGIANGTAVGNIMALTRFIDWAKSEKYHNTTDYQFYNKRISAELKVETKEKPCLHNDELLAFETVDLSKLRYDKPNTRESIDALVFNASIGLRYNRLRDVKIHNIINSDYGLAIEMANKKNKTPVFILMDKKSIDIFKKYSEGKTNDDLLFPNLPKQTNDINDIITEVARTAGLDRIVHQHQTKGRELLEYSGPLWKFLSSHCFRITRATNFIKKSIEVTGTINLDALADAQGWSHVSARRYYRRNKASILSGQAAVLNDRS